MPESNFVSEQDFEKLLNSLPIQSHKNEKLSVQDWEMLFTVIYGCALRIKEAVGLRYENFDLEHKILTLPETKTGYKKCKCSKWEKKLLIQADPNCEKCKGLGKFRVSQRTTILPEDANRLVLYLASRQGDKLLWPVSRQTVWYKFKSLCELSGLSYFWQKDERAFEKGWPYLLRSSRSKIMERDGAELSLIMLKMRHKGQIVTFRYTAQDIHALLNWEAEKYPLLVV